MPLIYEGDVMFLSNFQEVPILGTAPFLVDGDSGCIFRIVVVLLQQHCPRSPGQHDAGEE